MFNHFLRFTNEESAKQSLPGYLEGDGWNTTIVIPNQKIVLARATANTKEQTVPGYYMTITLDEINENLKNLGNNACRLIGYFETGEIVYMAPDVNTNVISVAIIEPVPSGAKYNFL